MENTPNTSTSTSTYMGFAVHNQVIKIKQEMEKTEHPSLHLHMRRVYPRDVNRLRSRSPLGLGDRAVLRC
ncbi:hypothetical protein Fmac_003719 [Flemingia macrophylla]|uniref:Uncharacterized protein n=1 Tax=Flemingia macrophylla TaxID=520843 RepID=A0ABD1N2Z7_9FABA